MFPHTYFISGEIATLGKWDHGRPATGASDQSEALSGNAVEKMLVWFDFKSHVGTVLANEIPYSVEVCDYTSLKSLLCTDIKRT